MVGGREYFLFGMLIKKFEFFEQLGTVHVNRK